MDETDVAFSGLAGQAELVRSRAVSARELLTLVLARIDRLDGRLGAFRIVDPDAALAQADAIDRRGVAADARALLGVPVAIKDNVDVAGHVTANGGRAHGAAVAADAEVVRRLRAAGAVIVGKTNVPELCAWPFTESAAWGVTRNPWDVTRTPGGSSGGSAAAVAAGLVAAALGSDSGGSIRIPAAACGLFGIKPQRGRIPLAGQGGDWHGTSCLGPLARSVLDAALFCDAVAGPFPGEDGPSPAAPGAFARAARTPPGQLRIAWSVRPPVPTRVRPAVRAALDETLAVLRSLGHRVERREIDHRPATRAYLPRYLAGVRDDAVAMAHPERLEPRTRTLARLGGPAARLVERSRRREPVVAARIADTLRDCDVLITPVVPGPPPAAGRFAGHGALRTIVGVSLAWPPYTTTWNLTGQPAASVPAGFDADGLPLAIQLVGRRDDEATLFSLAAQIEAQRPWATRRPPACT